MNESIRSKKIAGLVQREVSDIILHKLHDRHVGFVTVTNVSMSKDQRYAKIYISVMGEEKTRNETIKTLNHAAGYVQYEFSQRVKLRYIPQMRFYLDNSWMKRNHIEEVLHRLHETGEMGDETPQDGQLSPLEDDETPQQDQ